MRHILQMRQQFTAFLLAFGLAVAPAAVMAGDDRSERDSLGSQLDDAVERAIDSLEKLIDRMPMYEAPEVTPDGDIIIRKRKPEPAPLPEDQRRV